MTGSLEDNNRSVVIAEIAANQQRRWLSSRNSLGRKRQQARAQKRDAGAAVQLAAERLEPIDVPFNRAIAPRLGDRAFDGLQVTAAS